MSPPTTVELWQTEWCPGSHRVRQRLTELGLTYTIHQVPVERSARTVLEAATGQQRSPSWSPTTKSSAARTQS